MTVNEKLIEALSPLGLQLFPDMRQEMPDECMVFTYSETSRRTAGMTTRSMSASF